ncbi:hypothetical protein Clacol_006682 [Clathrus columnatus]|uniref:Acetate kinase n=1 Tax=Clathrus columnatus TaxID=1419009 RepID=A0AAV5AHT0_9AGAM|nr:hypothetical protein Clacol_006682 [Clathrus columnatus]
MATSVSSLILAVNAGSSSLKLALFTASPEPDLLCNWSASGIGSSDIRVKYSRHNNVKSDQINDHVSAFEFFLKTLDEDKENEPGSENISHICHRVVHGGSYTDPVEIDKTTLDRLAALSDLAPLSIPPYVYTYAIDPSVARQKNLRKYGFHGLSYAFILKSVAAFLHKPELQTSIIALHLGAGASACAIRDGLSIDTSMGLTPLSGLPGATRSGDIDPSLIFHYTAQGDNVGRMSYGKTRSMHITEAERVLNTEAGWKSLTGTTDFREIIEFVIISVGAFFVQLQGRVHALVFSGGLGENSSALRQAIVERSGCLGFDLLSNERNNNPPEGETVFDIGAARGGPKILVCKTNEELEIARQCIAKPEFWK